MTTIVRWLAAVCVSVILCAAAMGEDGPERLPAPDRAAQSAALKELKKEFQKELRDPEPGTFLRSHDA